MNMRNAFVAIALVAVAAVSALAGRASAQVPTATLRSFDSLQGVRVFDTEEALQRYLSSGINPSTGGRVAEGMNGESYQMHESKVTVLGRDSVHIYGSRGGDAPVYHVTLDDGREAWVEAVYVFP